MAHFHEVDFEGAPQALGYDEVAHQVLTCSDGFIDPNPSDLDISRLTEVGRVIRRLHDAPSTSVPPVETVWNVAIAPDREDLLCHHDQAPWNLVRPANKLTFIDWDSAGPGSRPWDLACAAHGFVPLSPDAPFSDQVAAQRLAALIQGHDLDQRERGRLVDMRLFGFEGASRV